MAEIKLQKRVKYAGDVYNRLLEGGFDIDNAVLFLEGIPDADVEPVVHGWWESVDSSYWRWTPSGAVSVSHTTYRCGRCGRGTVVKTSYCPNCGANMDGDGNADH